MTQSILISDEVRRYVQELRSWRERRGITQKELAEAMAYDPSRVSHIENRRQVPTEEFTQQAEAVLQTGGALWDCWEEVAALKLGLPLRPPERDLRTVEFVAWLARHSSLAFRELYTAVNGLVARLESQPPSIRYALEHQRSLVGRDQLADALIAYYSGLDRGRFYSARLAGTGVHTSILTQPAWIDTAVVLGTDAERFRFVPPDPAGSPPHLSDTEVNTALNRLASVELNGTVMINNPLYRLLEVELGGGELSAAVTTVDFAYHALSTELMERELLDAIADGLSVSPGSLPLRDTLLPDTRAAFNLRERACVGGPVALLAIARSPHPGTRDYVLLVQERSSTVLNAVGQLGLIPKAFHQPTGEPRHEVQISHTLQREFEEELLGRTDLEQFVTGSGRSVDPFHSHHLTEPMTWLLDNPQSYRVECTGFGFNMVTSNYEFSSLIMIHDEDWWNRFGGMIQTNWEAAHVHRYSSLDSAGVTRLIEDPRWGNESLFALLQGIRRLTDIGDPKRVSLPAVDVWA